MRLIVDLQSCQSGSRLGGIGRYSLELAKAMAAEAGCHDVLIAVNAMLPEQSFEVRKAFRGVLPPDAVVEFAVPQGISYLQKRPRVTRAAERVREAFLASLNPDAVHVSSLIEGLADEVVTSVGGVGDRSVTAVTLYDLIPYLRQESYLTDPTAKRHYLDKFEALKRADALLAISQFSADEGASILTGYKGVIANILGGIDPSFKRLAEPARGLESFLAEHGIKGPFLLYTASFDQRKNQRGLIEAFAEVSPRVRAGHKLVLVGNGWPGIYAELRALAVKRGLAETDIVFTGHVSDRQLLGLYNLCRLFVFPSHWEGLGLPVIEAMACGVPVIGSNTTSIREVLGDAIAEFDPSDTKQMAERITLALTDDAFRARLIEHGREHIKAFTWAQSARRAWAAIEEAQRLAASRPLPRVRSGTDPSMRREQLIRDISDEALDVSQLREVAYCIAANELEAEAPGAVTVEQRIGVVSSWAMRCGIASYTRNLVESMGLPVTVLAAHVDEPMEFGPTPSIVCWRQGPHDTLEHLAATIERLALTDVFIQFNYGFFAFPALDRLIREQIRRGRRVYVTLHATMDPPPEILAAKLADIAGALALCSAVFVHSVADVARLKALGVVRPVVLVPQGVRLIELARSKRRGARQRIASYGFFLPGKGFHQLIEALALMRDQGRDVELLMVNADYGDSGGVSRAEIAAGRDLVKKLRLGDHVTFETDYLEDDQSLALLAGADLVVYPYQGTRESSSAAVRTGLASLTPVAVTPLPIFEDVGRATHPLPGITPTEMADGIGALLDALAVGTGEAVRTVAAAADRWRAANDVKRVAAFTRKLFRKHAAHHGWTLDLAQDAGEMALGSGVLDGDVVRANGAAGMVVYGPYASLVEGVYRFTMFGEAEQVTAAEVGYAELSADCGGRVLAKVALAPSASDALADALIHVPEGADNVEVRVFTTGAAPMSVRRWEIRRRIV